MWEKYKEYLDDFEQDYFVRFLPGYLLNEGTTLWHEWRFYWELLDNLRKNWIKARLVPFNIEMLLNDYLGWIKSSSARKNDYESDEPTYSYDEDYEHYKFILSICSFYNIGDIHPVAGRLSLAHQLRLLLFATRKRLFDGSKQKVEEIFNNIELGAGMKLVIQTMTGDENGIDTQSATCKLSLIKSESAEGFSYLFNKTDQTLFNGGFYNIPILGIVYEYDIINSDALVYDIEVSKYDDDKKYDRGETSLE